MLRLLRKAFAIGNGSRRPPARNAVVDERMREAHAARQAGDMARLAELSQAVLDEEPDHAGALHLLAVAAAVRGNNEEAAALLRRAISLSPKDAEYHYGLGCVLQACGDAAGAIESFRCASDLAPEHALARMNLGCLLQQEAERASSEALMDEARAHLQAAADLAPEHADAWLNLGYAAAQRREPAEAERHYDRALRLDPASALARLNRAMTRLTQGRYSEAWEDYEARWAASGYPRPDLGRPEWAGEPLAGKTILVYTEQGFGDAIQFVRYARLLAQQGAKVLMRCPRELVRLFARAAGVHSAFPGDAPPPPFDVHCALLSLPRLFRTDRTSVPAEVPYLAIDAASVERWRARLAPAQVRIGIVWASQSLFPGAERKSIPPSLLGALEGIPGVAFHSLQMGEAGRALSQLPLAMRDLTPEISDFADTAAAISALDLVVSVDTAVAHLAGALGRPVCTLLPYVADWRWEPDEAASLWYPTMRLYRQAAPGDWPRVLLRLAEDLRRRSLPTGRT